MLIEWHIDDIYIPGSPDSAADLNGQVSIRIDREPTVTNDIFQRAKVTTRRRTQIKELTRGHHTVQFSMNGGTFSACFATPGQSTITHWYTSDEPLPVY